MAYLGQWKCIPESLVVLPTSLNDSIQYDVVVYIRYHILNPTVHYFVRIYDIYNMIFREF